MQEEAWRDLLRHKRQEPDENSKRYFEYKELLFQLNSDLQYLKKDMYEEEKEIWYYKKKLCAENNFLVDLLEADLLEADMLSDEDLSEASS